MGDRSTCCVETSLFNPCSATLLVLAGMLPFGCFARGANVPAPVIANDRVVVWDVSLSKGQPGPATPHDLDCVIMFLEGGRIRTVDGHGKASSSTRQFGDALFVPRGTDARDTVVAGGPALEIVVALKGYLAPTYNATSTYPTAFPRPGSIMSLDDPRFTVWRYDWEVGQSTAMHVHDKDFVVVFRYNATQLITQADGETRTSEVRAGDTFFRTRGLTHSEQYPTDPQSALFLELK